MPVIIVLILMWSSMIYANGLGVIGDWQTINHQTNRPSNMIHIWKWKSRFYRKVAKIFPENGHKVTDRCWVCKGKFRGKRILDSKDDDIS